MNPNRYLFDMDFSPRSAVAPSMEAHDDVIQNETPQSAYERGYAAGRLDAGMEQQAISSDYLSQILKSLEDWREKSRSRQIDIEHQIRNAIKDLTNRFISEIRTIDILTNPEFGFSKIFNSLDRDANLILSVSKSEFETFQKLAHETGLSPRTLIMVDETRADGSFELTWADGGMLFDKAALQRALRDTAEKYDEPEVDLTTDSAR